MKKLCSDSVMIVDDNDIDIFVNQKVLEFNNFTERIISMGSGREALEYLRTAKNGNIPDLIFLDLNMPVIDGFKFLFEFAQFPDDVRKKSSVVVLTSSDNDRDKEKIAANVDVMQFVSKPLNDQKLEEIKVQYLKRRAEQLN